MLLKILSLHVQRAVFSHYKVSQIYEKMTLEDEEGVEYQHTKVLILRKAPEQKSKVDSCT